MTSKKPQRRFLPNSKSCFVCGEENKAGLKTRFFIEDGVVKSIFQPLPHHCGYGNIVHGGVVAAILDECMGWAASRLIERMCFTADLTVRYLKPVPAHPMVVSARVQRGGRRLVQSQGWVTDESGEEFARAEGRFVPLTIEQTLEVDDNLLYRGDEERVFDKLRESQALVKAPNVPRNQST